MKVLKSDKAMTLIEIMFSIFILSFIFAGLIALFIQINDLTLLIKEHSIAGSALNERMEELRGMSFSSVSAIDSVFTTSGMTELNGASGSAVIDDPFGDSDIRRVTLTLTWTSMEGRSMTKNLAAYFVNSGINGQ